MHHEPELAVAVKLQVESNTSISQLAQELDCGIAKVIERAIKALKE